MHAVKVTHPRGGYVLVRKREAIQKAKTRINWEHVGCHAVSERTERQTEENGTIRRAVHAAYGV